MELSICDYIGRTGERCGKAVKEGENRCRRHFGKDSYELCQICQVRHHRKNNAQPCCASCSSKLARKRAYVARKDTFAKMKAFCEDLNYRDEFIQFCATLDEAKKTT